MDTGSNGMENLNEMNDLIGEFFVTLDDKYRISLPAPLRKILNQANLFITKGPDKCLRVYTPDKWLEMKNDIMENTDPYSKTSLSLRRLFIGPSQMVEIDKAGRIHIAESLREFAGLLKTCVVIGQIDYIDIYSDNHFKKLTHEETEAALEELGNLMRNNKRGSE
jgi:MraZ protein